MRNFQFSKLIASNCILSVISTVVLVVDVTARRFVVLFFAIAPVIVFGLIGCVNMPVPGDLVVQRDEGPVKLELKPTSGDRDLTQYRSRSLTTSYIDGQIRHKMSESVDFRVETKVLKVDSANKTATFLLTTTQKDGKADMNDFALPEVDEPMEVVLTPKAQVVRAGSFPPGTIFYVPPIALPTGDVRVGDTWPLEAEWMSLKNGISLKMEIVSTLKSIRDCGAPGRCAEIEVSGGVVIPGAQSLQISSAAEPEAAGIKFSSELRGKFLFSLSKGTVLYSVVRTNEKMNSTKHSAEVASCMISYVIEPVAETLKLKGDGKDCHPTAELPNF